MDRDDVLHFELYVMDLVERAKCVTASDYERIAEQLHESVETAIQDMCIDNGIDDYSPSY
ncbi:MAG: hypothetical protein IKG04_01370 [Exiguobacterium sp.]|nr:hypothetical protein [Exiguobacterium sp.]